MMLLLIETSPDWWSEFVEKLTNPVVMIGFLGQGIFASRMLVQWIATERARQSVVPVTYWYLSVIGASITLGYAIWVVEPPFIVAQAGGLVVYLRNLYFIESARRLARREGTPAPHDPAAAPEEPRERGVVTSMPRNRAKRFS